MLLDGTSLLASSNMCSRYWTGHLSVYNTPEDLGDNSKCKSYMEFDGGIPCAKFISDSKVTFILHDSRFCLSKYLLPRSVIVNTNKPLGTTQIIFKCVYLLK